MTRRYNEEQRLARNERSRRSKQEKRDELNARQREVYWADPDKARKRAREYAQRHESRIAARRYGISVQELESMRESNECCLCGQVSSTGLHVDHDHNTNEVRGLLCRRCNIGMHYVDDERWLEMAIKYKR